MSKLFKVWSEKLGEKLRKCAFEKGFTCDGCGRELFDYPKRRFCIDCEEKLERNDKRRCEKCGRQTVAEGVCLNCKKVKPQFTKALSPFVYKGFICSVINRFKNGDRYLSCYFAEKLADYALENYPDLFHENGRTMSALNEWDGQNTPPMSKMSVVEKSSPLLLVPVPMTEKDKRARGYNQATELAKRVRIELEKRSIQVEIDEEILIKVKQTLPQKQGGFSQRTQNLEGAFHVHKRKACRNARILLIDDIMTTGATASECSARLLGAGAKEVTFLSIVSLQELK